MENQKLKVAMNEISDFIHSRMNGLLHDLLVESNEYEETKQCILGLPFVKQIIQNTINQDSRYNYSSIVNNDVCNLDSKVGLHSSVGIEDLEELIILNKSFQEDEKTVDAENDNCENIYLHIEESVDSYEPHCVCCGGTRDMITDRCLTCLEDCDTCRNEEVPTVEQEVIEEEQEVIEEEQEVLEEEQEVLEEEQEVPAVEQEVLPDVEQEVPTVEQEVLPDVEQEVPTVEQEIAAVEQEIAAVEQDEEEEDEENEVFEIEIDGVTYFTTNEKSGVIYNSDENGDPDEEVGVFQNGKAIFNK